MVGQLPGALHGRSVVTSFLCLQQYVAAMYWAGPPMQSIKVESINLTSFDIISWYVNAVNNVEPKQKS